MGESTVPVVPQRVVVLDTGELDSVVALGMQPVGAVRAPVDDGLLDYLGDQLRGTQLVGTISEPNLEAVAALQPDLILSSKLRHEAVYDDLSAIAPTVFTEAVGAAWKDNLRLHAQALGKTAEGERLLADYERRADELARQLGDPAATQVSVVRFLPDETRLYATESFIGSVLADVGMARPPSQAVEEFAVNVGPEQISQADGDIIYVSTYGDPAESTQPLIISSPLWERLDAVERDAVVPVPDDTWMLGIGIGAAQQVLDDLNETLPKG